MRSHTRFILSIMLLFFPTYQLRDHLTHLLQVAQAHRSFHAFLANHPETLYRYPVLDYPDSALNPVLVADRQLVPRLLHRLVFTEDDSPFLEGHDGATQTCQDLNPNWKHTVWTKDFVDVFIFKHYPSLHALYTGYKHDFQRVGLARWAILDHFGGVYLDLRISCRQSLEPIRNAPFLTTSGSFGGITDEVIVSRPGHPFVKLLLDALPSRDLRWGLSHLEKTMTVGCGALTSI